MFWYYCYYHSSISIWRILAIKKDDWYKETTNIWLDKENFAKLYIYDESKFTEICSRSKTKTQYDYFMSLYMFSSDKGDAL